MTSREQKPAKVPGEVYDAVVEGYYSAAITASENARARSNTAWAIASAIATALVALGIFSGIEDEPWFVQLAGSAALLFWLVTALAFMWAVITPFAAPPEPATSRLEFVQRALKYHRADATAVQGRQKRAFFVTLCAALVTVLAISLGIFYDPAARTLDATVHLSEEGTATLQSLCGKSMTSVNGELEVESLEKDYLALDTEAGTCLEHAETLAIPREQATAVTTDDTGDEIWPM